MYLTLSVAFNVASYLVYKSISDKEHDLSWSVLFLAGLLLGAINIFLFTKALKQINLAVAYPIFSGACIALIMILSSFIFREKITVYNIIGAAIVVIGIAFLTK
jgi:multidrug transporter EmrE-like cation transporter